MVMAQHDWLDTSPFFFEGGSVGCLLIHGFTGAPPEMRPMGEYLAGKGLTVLGVRLPGHGTRVEDMDAVRWSDWTQAVEDALNDLKARCQAVFVAGLSMGGLLTLYLGERHEVAGLIPMAAALKQSNPLLPLVPIAKYFIRGLRKADPAEADFVDPETYNKLWSYEIYPTRGAHELLKLQQEVRPLLGQITAPILIVQGEKDNMVSPETAREIFDRVGSRTKDLMMVPDSGHIVTLDAAHQRVWERVYAFITEQTPAHAAANNATIASF
jgi:carboxylesterase